MSEVLSEKIVRPGRADRAEELPPGRYLRGANPYHGRSVYVQPWPRAQLAVGDDAALWSHFARLKPSAERPQTQPLKHSLPQRLSTALLEAERWILHEQGRCDAPSFAHWEEEGSDGLVMVWDSRSPAIARFAVRVVEVALQCVAAGVRAADLPRAAAFRRELARIRRWTQRHRWSATAAALSHAAQQQGLPHEVLAGQYVRLGEGCHQVVVTESSLGLSSGADAVRDASGAALLERALPAASRNSLPTALILGPRGTRWIAGSAEAALRSVFEGVGCTTDRWTSIQGQPVESSELGCGAGLEFLLRDPRVDVLLSAMTPRRLLRRGLRTEQVAVTALVGAGRSEEELRAAEVALSVTAGRVFLRSDHPHRERLLADLAPQRVVLVGQRRKDPVLRRHLAAGGEVLRPARGKPSESVEWVRGDLVIGRVPVLQFRGSCYDRDGRLRRKVLFAAGLELALNELAEGTS